MSVDFSVLKGMNLVLVQRVPRADNGGDSDELRFQNWDGRAFCMKYQQDCCASCDIVDVVGDLEDLLHHAVLMADVESSNEDNRNKKAEPKKWKAIDESWTWVFYKLATIKGSVTISWYGSSNGYYSETANFEEVDRWAYSPKE